MWAGGVGGRGRGVGGKFDGKGGGRGGVGPISDIMAMSAGFGKNFGPLAKSCSLVQASNPGPKRTTNCDGAFPQKKKLSENRK